MPAIEGRSNYETFALRYASRRTFKSQQFLRFDLYSEPDQPLGVDYFFWLVRGPDATILVDCGFDRDRAAILGREQDTDPVELLARMGVATADVDHVILTHMHYDHVGNVGLFPNATFSVAREEYDFWTGPYGHRQLMQNFVHPQDVRTIDELAREQRLHLIDGSEELFPGVLATRLGGHTPGQLMVEVTTRAGQIVLASDSIHYYQEMDLDRPFHIYDDIGQTYRAYETLRQLDARAGTTVVAGHDPTDFGRFKTVDRNCLDLTTPSFH